MTLKMSSGVNRAGARWTALAGVAAIAGFAGLALILLPAGYGQTPSSFSGLAVSASKQFDVATVKISRGDELQWRLGPPGHGSVSVANLPLRKILASSFRIQDSMVVGPPWLATARYDIVGKGPDPSAPNADVWEMMRSLLASRFHLKYHLETRESKIYALTVASGGAKLGKPEDGRCASAITENKPCGDIQFLRFGVGIVNQPIGALVGALGRSLQDRPIVDMTGLTGKYDVAVTWLPEDANQEDLPKEGVPTETSVFAALEKQAGLKLVARKGPLQVLVVDSIAKPEGN
jgi:uncharacterized protein (TIGR03435 family)